MPPSDRTVLPDRFLRPSGACRQKAVGSTRTGLVRKRTRVGEAPQSEFVQVRRLPLGLVADPAQRTSVELCSLCWIAAAQTDRPCAEYAPTFLAAAIMKAVFAQVMTISHGEYARRLSARRSVRSPPWSSQSSPCPRGLRRAASLLAVMQRATYWRMYGLYTFSLVLFLASPGDVGFEAEERGFQILAGIALLILGLAVLHPITAGWPGDTHSQNWQAAGPGWAGRAGGAPGQP